MFVDTDGSRILGDGDKREYVVELNDGGALTISAVRTDCAWGVFVFYENTLELVAAIPIASVKTIVRSDVNAGQSE